MTQMDDNALNKDHNKTTSMPTTWRSLAATTSIRNSR